MTAIAPSSPIPAAARLLWIATALGFAAGLPYSLLVGSMGVWLTNAGAGFGAIGALSWIALFYAFKFIWSPAFDWVLPPFVNSIGRRRAWIALCQVIIVLCLFGMTLFDPRASLLGFAALAVIASFASASQDIVIDAWRIETAQDDEQLDSITVRYQLGYRMAAIIGGALALLLADVWAVERAQRYSATEPGAMAGQYGALRLEADGDFVYVLDPSNTAIVALTPESAPLEERFVIPAAVNGAAVDAEILKLTIAPPEEGPAIKVESGSINVFSGLIRTERPGSDIDGAMVSGNAFLNLASGWPAIWMFMAVLMAIAVFATLAAPEPLLAPKPESAVSRDPEARRLRRLAVWPVAIGWAGAGAALLGFMFYTLADPSASAAQFRDAATPWILLVTVGMPLAISFWLARKPGALETGGGSKSFTDILYERVLAPLADIVKRYWLWAIPILALAMTYRIADSIWGSFANPFYLTILQHSNSDVAVASKMVGVAATLVGIALGGLALIWIGRMPALILGGLVAAGTNLLYADLAHGGAGTQAVLDATGLGGLFAWLLSGFVGSVQATGAPIFDGVTLGDGLTRLTSVILMENLAGGFASAVHVAWLSSIVNKNYAAVQYALLSSLALLIGVIFRPRIGAFVDAVKDQGLPAQAERFAEVFVFAAWVGMVAVALAGLEWWRQRRASGA